MGGVEAAKLFYDTDRFLRHGATPARVQKTLFGQGGVQGLDGEAHRWRKQMFMALMTPGRIQQLADIVADTWHAAISTWEMLDTVVLFDEVQQILCRAVCAWSGVPLVEAEVEQRVSQLGALIEGPAAFGPMYWRARQSRRHTEKWGRDLVTKIRKRKLDAPEGSALYIIAYYRNLNGNLLDPEIAAVELLNVLRPTVAISRFVIFATLALHEHPEYRQKLQRSDDCYLELFVQEVRRYYPFFPFVAARVQKTFEWQDYCFPKGRQVILDLYGTNHDAQLWEQPDTFQPEHFRQWDGNAFNFNSPRGRRPLPQSSLSRRMDHN